MESEVRVLSAENVNTSSCVPVVVPEAYSDASMIRLDQYADVRTAWNALDRLDRRCSGVREAAAELCASIVRAVEAAHIRMNIGQHGEADTAQSVRLLIDLVVEFLGIQREQMHGGWRYSQRAYHIATILEGRATHAPRWTAWLQAERRAERTADPHSVRHLPLRLMLDTPWLRAGSVALSWVCGRGGWKEMPSNEGAVILAELEASLRQLERYSFENVEGNSLERWKATIRALRDIADYAEQGLLFDQYDVAGPGQDRLHMYRSECEDRARDEVVRRITLLRERSADYLAHLIKGDT